MRRSKRFPALVVVLAMALVGAACGDDDDGGGGAQDTTAPAATSAPGGTGGGATTTAPAPDDVDPDGVLRTYSDLASQGGHLFDGTKVGIASMTAPHALVLGTLFRVNVDGSWEPELAESAEIVDPNTVRVVLREGVQFSDGTPYDAEAFKFNVERNRDAKHVNLSTELQEIENVTVENPTTATIHLKTPIAGAVYDRLPYVDFMFNSPTAIRAGQDVSTQPVGAGPFLLTARETGRIYRYEKNPNYWNADNIRLAGVEIIHAEPGQGPINAIQAGDVDVSGSAFSYEQSKAIAGSGWEIETSVTDNIMLWGQWCKSRPPFEDVRVRQAINYAIDRDAINQAVYDGNGEPMWGFFASESPLHDESLDGFYAYDPEKAKQLLAEAGQTDLTFDSFFTPGASQRAVEIIQAQLAEIGVTLNPKPLLSSQDFFPDATGAPINIFQLERTGIQKVARTLVPGSVGNICNWNDPELNELVNQIKALDPESSDAVSLWADLQRNTLEKAASLFVNFGVRAWAYNPDRVGDPNFLLNFQGRPEYDFYRMYIKA